MTIPRRASGAGVAPLSFAQARWWFLDRLEPARAALLNWTRITRWRGPLDVEVLERSLAEVLRRHEALRTRFVATDGDVVQEAVPLASFHLPLVDLTGLPESERADAARRLALEEFRTPVDLTAGRLLRPTLVRLDAEEHLLVLVVHHITSDGWSMQILHRELATLYSAFAGGRPSPLPELPIQYGDYAAWQREHFSAEASARELAYWRERLAGAPPALELPTDHPRSAVQTYRGDQVSLRLPAELVRGLALLARQERASLFMVLLAAFKALLSRYTGQRDLLVGIPIAGRFRVELEGLVGALANSLVLRTDLSHDPTFRELLARVRGVALGAYAHQELPFEKLVEELQPERSARHHPLFQVLFNFRDFSPPPAEAGGLHLEDVRLERGTTLFDLSMALVRDPDGIVCGISYNSDLFDRTTIERVGEHYRRVLEGALANPAGRLSELPLLTGAERHRLLVEWNDTAASWPTDRCIHQLFEDQVRRTPDAVALVFEDERVTYRQLNDHANELGMALAERGIGRGAFVPILMERGAEVVVAMLAVMKAGAAFVPLDPDWPAERVRVALDELNSPLLLANPAWAARDGIGGRSALVVGTRAVGRDVPDHDRPASPADPIYAIYTSGSTGRPKAAIVPHRGITNRFLWMNDFFGSESAGAALQTTRHIYDSAVWQLFWPLINGGKTVIPSPGLELNAEHLAGLIERHGVTITDFVPSVFNTLVPQLVTDETLCRALQALRTIIVGGEEISPATTYSFMERFPGVRVVNLYGPTEASIGCICYQVTGREGGRIPIGRPISNVQVLVLDAAGNPVPVGVPGELHLAGACVGLGYLGDEAKTGAAFVEHAFAELAPGRVYRTGDLVRFRPDGNLDFLGRLDQQVKLRGHRIELGEVESLLGEHPGVRSAVAMVREDTPGDRRLVAYFVPAGAPPRPGELRRHLELRLPPYMVPESLVPLAVLPLASSGKVDRRALPVPGPAAAEDDAYEPPRTPVEQSLAGIWAAVLGREGVGLKDHFFRLGGHSLKATQVIARIQRTLGVELPLRALFEHPTLGALADRIEAVQANGSALQGEAANLLAELESLSEAEADRLLAAERAAGDPAAREAR